jgi:hypothetical protein
VRTNVADASNRVNRLPDRRIDFFFNGIDLLE